MACSRADAAETWSAILTDRRRSEGTAFSLEERRKHGLEGLLYKPED
ncbi:hypothetical protein [Methylobacterium sp. R2-1]|nr:hypothetical protein [Methylobacterium sp. R2-1]MBB2964013.1 hypothetical protein [Methylobacterium sp. R2-1]